MAAAERSTGPNTPHEARAVVALEPLSADDCTIGNGTRWPPAQSATQARPGFRSPESRLRRTFIPTAVRQDMKLPLNSDERDPGGDGAALITRADQATRRSTPLTWRP